MSSCSKIFTLSEKGVNILITVCPLPFFFLGSGNGMQNTFLVHRPEEKNTL